MLLLAASILVGSPASQQRVTAAAILADLRQRHATSVVSSLLESPDAWNTVMKGVASADPDWFKVAHGLASGADAGAGVDLEMAVSEALLVAPERTLREFGYAMACSRLGFDDLELLTRAKVAELVEKRAVALSRMPASLLPNVKKQCLAQLRQQQEGRQYAH